MSNLAREMIEQHKDADLYRCDMQSRTLTQLWPWLLHAQAEAEQLAAKGNRCSHRKRRVTWPVVSLPARRIQALPHCKLNQRVCAYMSGCAGSSSHPWELTA